MSINISIFFCVFFFWLSPAFSYPEFIGYGYASCMTCHYNGNGGGPLSDYGRALWSSEIASRWIFSKNTSDEQIAADSGFLGPIELPDWIRPHIKYRGMSLRTSPGGPNDTTKFYQMQADFGFILQDPKSKYVGMINWGHMPLPSQYGTGKSGLDRFLARDYYVRAEVFKSWWIYAGLMDKVFGLRNIDHSSFQRTHQTFNVQNNTPDGIAEAQGIIVQTEGEKWGASVNYFIGNPYDDQPYWQNGLSGLG